MDTVDVQLYSCLHLALDVGGWVMPHPASLPPGWRNYSMYRKVDGFKEQTGQMQKSDTYGSSNLILSSL